MKRFVYFLTIFTIAIFVSSVALFANGKINKAHAALKAKNVKPINCGYCHGPIAKKKDQKFLKGQVKYKDHAKVPACAGSGCHK